MPAREGKQVDRAVLADLLLKGMACPPANQRLWIIRCFEIAPSARGTIEIHEYQTELLSERCAMTVQEMARAGSSIVNLSTGQVERRRSG